MNPMLRVPSGYVLVPDGITKEMYDAARNWSCSKYGKPIGNEAAAGCWKAMLAAAPAAFEDNQSGMIEVSK